MTKLDRVVSVASWLVVAALLVSIVFLWYTPPSGAGPVAQALGVVGAQIFYTVVYGVEAVLLTFAKLTGRMRLRKASLLAIFFTGAFTLGLTIVILGFSITMLDNMAMFGFAGLCYLYWKIKTEYVSRDDFDAIIGRDSQPS